MTKFQSIVKQAIRGVNSGGLLTEEIDPRLQESFQKINQSTPVKTFLSKSAMIHYFELTGKVTKKTQTKLSKAPTESKPYISKQVKSILHQIFAEDLGDYEPEFFYLVKKHGQILSSEFLPPYLEKLYKGKIEADLLEPIIGERGHWLVKQNISWQNLFINNDLNQDNWDYGTKEERLKYLKELRKNDPQKALDLIKDTWKKEKTKSKLDLLETLEINTNQDDEDFLHDLWKKGSKDLSNIAIGLLAKIPDSRYSKQQHTFLRKVISVNKEFLKGKRVIIEENYDLLNENVDLVPNILNKNQKWDLDIWLTELVKLVYLDFWTEILQEQDIGKIIDLLEKSSKNRTIWTRGLSIAAKRQQRKDWAAKLFTKFASIFGESGEEKGVVNLLKPQEVSQIISKEFSNLNSQGYNPVLQLIATCYKPTFESEFIEQGAALQMVKYLILQTDIRDKYYYYKREPSQDLSRWIKIINPEIKQEIYVLFENKVKSEGKEITDGYFEDTLQILEIRYRIYRAFNID